MRLSNLLIPARLIRTAALQARSRLFLRDRDVDVTSQRELARLVNHTAVHQIRAGRTHRFIDLMFVTVDDRVFCRRYTYSEPSWRTVFLEDPDGQVRLDGVTVDIEARVPTDLDDINLSVNQAYVRALERLGVPSMTAGATNARAMASTMEITWTTLT